MKTHYHFNFSTNLVKMYQADRDQVGVVRTYTYV